MSPQTNKSILKGDLGTFGWNFIHKAKTNSLAVNSRPHITGINRNCRRCHKTEETMSHAIQFCLPNMSMITKRHDACLQKVYNKLKNPDFIIILDDTCPYIKGCNLRVDLMITHVSKKKIFLVDMKCPMDTRQNFEIANNKNLEKYANLRKELQSLFKDHSVELFTLIIGSLGTISSNASNILIKIGIPESDVGNLLRFCAISNIEHSSKIWHYHHSGNLIQFDSKSNH